jgi:type II secretory ATPase GspE/PulE/Tfp pilus assembly ATPase PilB-like protein
VVEVDEIMVVTEAIQGLIIQKASAAQLKQEARSRTLFDAGLEKVKLGLTTPEELLRIAEE